MSGRKSVDKGKAREREVVQLLRVTFDLTCRTGHMQGEGGKHRKPDVIGVPGLYLSVKGGKAPRVLEAVEEARKEAKGRRVVPAVAFRRDGRGPWWVAVPLDTFRDVWAEHLDATAKGDL